MRIALIAVALLAACSSTPRKVSSDPGSSINVIATTDFHGELVGQENPTADGALLRIGGAPVYATYHRILREHLQGPTLWIDAGDLFQGSMESNLFEGAPVVRLMNHLGLQAAALGNHEFDYGPVGEKAVQRTPRDDPRGALKARIREARFPTLAANVITTRNEVPKWLKKSTVITVGGTKVGVVGGASPGTPGTTNALNLAGLKFLPLQPALTQEAERLRREEGVQLVVVTVHEGGGCEDNSVEKQDDDSSCADKTILELAKSFPPGLVNMIVAGHSHKGVAKRVNGIVVIQPFSHGKYIGWAKLPVDGSLGSVEGLQPVCLQTLTSARGQKTCDPFQLKNVHGAPEPATFFGEAVQPDAATAALLAPELDQVKTLKETALGFRILDPIPRAFLGESPLGNLMADVSKETMPGADLGLANGGGLRANLNPGAATYGDVFSVLPFDNQMALMKVPGDKLTELVKVGLFGRVGTYSWSANLKLETEGCELKSLTVDGQPVDPTRVYKVLTSDFLAGGGSGVSRINLPPENVEIYWDRNQLFRELAVGVLKRWGRDLKAGDFFSNAAPRQKMGAACQ